MREGLSECGWVKGWRRKGEKSKYIDNQGLKELKY
jgi:hypothetical protein